MKTVEAAAQPNRERDDDDDDGGGGGGDVTVIPPTAIIFLTKVGGGVFGNDKKWIIDAIKYAIDAVRPYNVDLDIRIVHYGSIEDGYDQLIS